MGQGGYFTLVNGTQYTWRLDPNAMNTKQVIAWNFPEHLPPGQTAEIYLQLDQGWFVNKSETQLRRIYHLEGTRGCSFQIMVTDAPSAIRVTLNGFSTPGHPIGNEFDLGWEHDATVRFILSGTEGYFSSNSGPIDWMQQNLRKLGNRPLSQLCIPGTRNAGISTLDQRPESVIAPMLLCQSSPVHKQLLDGSRYLDIRPVIGGGALWTGHYNQVKGLDSLWIGDRGQSLRSIVDDINRFTAVSKELVIVNLSHAINTDVGATNYRPLDQGEWNRVLEEFGRVHDRFVVPVASEAAGLTKQPLHHFIGPGRAAVIIVVEDGGVALGGYQHQGFFTAAEVGVNRLNSDRDDCAAMTREQLQKLDTLDSASDPRLFLLSWTLTPQTANLSFSNDWEFVWNGSESTKCVKTLAYSANKALFLECLPHCHGRNIPNVVYVDYLDGTDFAALAMAVNDRCFPFMMSKL
ncbi:plc-like phosphodiesterase [Diplodia corticola]|uniref:Plc-like phosphodiesterase n=1 Tax=Diplodia corticola TaxID=236234 RepID=A0A1J9RDX2_9PEZI|nr:plc-like phosphodiesterase [Diplodia corticola]OJD38641.1 plc-like phosphodiesterase [Diplodia corticola]